MTEVIWIPLCVFNGSASLSLKARISSSAQKAEKQALKNLTKDHKNDSPPSGEGGKSYQWKQKKCHEKKTICLGTFLLFSPYESVQAWLIREVPRGKWSGESKHCTLGFLEPQHRKILGKSTETLKKHRITMSVHHYPEEECRPSTGRGDRATAGTWEEGSSIDWKATK